MSKLELRQQISPQESISEPCEPATLVSCQGGGHPYGGGPRSGHTFGSVPAGQAAGPGGAMLRHARHGHGPASSACAAALQRLGSQNGRVVDLVVLPRLFDLTGSRDEQSYWAPRHAFRAQIPARFFHARTQRGVRNRFVKLTALCRSASARTHWSASPAGDTAVLQNRKKVGRHRNMTQDSYHAEDCEPPAPALAPHGRDSHVRSLAPLTALSAQVAGLPALPAKYRRFSRHARHTAC